MTASLRLSRLFAVAGVMVLGSAADCLDALEDPEPCLASCDVEDECGFRTVAECEAASCDALTGLLLDPVRDACLDTAGDCLEAAACACDGGCAKVDECAGSPDPGCVETCDTLVDQEPEATYRENACRLEAACADLAACSSVSG